MGKPLKSKIFIASILFVGGMLIYIFGSSFKYIDPTEIGVKMNYLSGKTEIISQSGNILLLPSIEELFLLDSSPQKFVMSGDKNKSANHVRKLTVRAKDGSNFYFDELEIQYQIIPGKADVILKDSGPGDAYKSKWLKPISRKVLRDEFGRYSSEEIANPTQYGSAKEKSKETLNRILNKHGIRIIDISTPKPRFDAIYEKTIEARINANEEVEKQKDKRKKLAAEKNYRLKKIQNDKAIEYQQIEGELKRQLINAEKELIRVKNDADEYKIRQIGIGEAKRVEMITRADSKKIQFQKDAQALEKKLKAMAEQGDAIVYKILAEKYRHMSIQLQPYSIDATPQRVQVESIGSIK